MQLLKFKKAAMEIALNYDSVGIWSESRNAPDVIPLYASETEAFGITTDVSREFNVWHSSENPDHSPVVVRKWALHTGLTPNEFEDQVLTPAYDDDEEWMYTEECRISEFDLPYYWWIGCLAIAAKRIDWCCSAYAEKRTIETLVLIGRKIYVMVEEDGTERSSYPELEQQTNIADIKRMLMIISLPFRTGYNDGDTPKSVPRAIFVLGPARNGKSKLIYEFWQAFLDIQEPPEGASNFQSGFITDMMARSRFVRNTSLTRLQAKVTCLTCSTQTLTTAWIGKSARATLMAV